MKYTIHPAADCFPMIGDTEFTKFRADIKANGQLDPIKMFNGAILDGRNRMRACEDLGITPICEDIKPDDPIGYVISVNIARRHLTPKQRAAIAADLANLKIGDVKTQKKDGPPNGGPPISVAEAAEKMNVSTRSVERAKAVKKTDPKAHEDAKAGVKAKPKPKATKPKAPAKRGWKDAVQDLIAPYGISREKMQRYGERDGLRGKVEERLGHKIPARVTPTEAQQIADIFYEILPLDDDEIAALKLQIEVEQKALPVTAQDKVKVLLRKRMKLIEIEIEARVKEQLEKFLPMYREKADKYDEFIDTYKGIFTNGEYNGLVGLVHYDTYAAYDLDEKLKEKHNAAFDLLQKKKDKLCGPKKNGNGNGSLPKTVADLMAMRKR